MWRHPFISAAFLLYVGWGAWNWFADRPVRQPDGILAPQEPRQSDLAAGRKIQLGRWSLTERARYQITARVLGRERYRFDALSDLIPEDLALGWGPMSDNRILRVIEVSQSNRFYYWRMPRESPLDRESIIAHSANTHVIPRDASVARQISRLRPGQLVTLSGELVDAVRDDGRWIKTSMVRTDTGAGACEVMLVDLLIAQ
jgi:hypothetical protein